MRCRRKTMQKMYYSNRDGEVPVYQKDDDGNTQYLDIDGELKPIPTGETEPGYTIPKEFYSSMSMSGGESEDKAFGIDISQYDATIILPKNALKLQEGSFIWVDSEIAYKDMENTIVDKTSADYKVAKVVKSPNWTRYVLSALAK